MPDAFFSKSSSASKRKRPSSTIGSRGGRGGAKSTSSSRPAAAGGSSSSSKSKKKRDEELSDDGGAGSDVGVDDMDLRRDTRGGESDDEERVRSGRETGGEKRLRMAREYLEGIEKEQDDGTYDAAEIDREIMAARLQSDVLSHSPKIYLFPSSTLSPHPRTYFLPIPSLPPTSAVASPSTPHLYVSSKSGAITKFSLQTGKLLVNFPRQGKGNKKGKGKQQEGWLESERVGLEGHTDEVLDLAVSEDGKWLASAGRDGIVGCWDVDGEGGKWARGLRGHRDAVTGVSFRTPTLTLFSTSLDRTISIHSLSTLSHLETLFGHQDSSPSLSSLSAESLISAGGRDRTVRFWKIPEESQLVFRGGGASKGVWEEDDDVEEEREREERMLGKEGEGKAKLERRKRRAGKGKDAYREGSIDCVAMVDEQNFLSGGDSGAICLWTITKKKPVFTVHLAHGINEHVSETEGTIGTARWITSIACLPYGDTFATGSWDGSIRVWSLAPNLKSFSPLFTIPAKGFVNSLQITQPPASIVDFSHWRLPNPSSSSNPSTLAASTKASAGEREEKKDRKKTLLLVGSVSQEPRLGRWMRLGKDVGVRNGVVVAHLEERSPEEALAEEGAIEEVAMED